jgi:predicted nucleotidyltransferase
VARAVERAVRQTRAEDRVRVLGLEQTGQIIAAEQKEAVHV